MSVQWKETFTLCRLGSRRAHRGAVYVPAFIRLSVYEHQRLYCIKRKTKLNGDIV